MSNLRAAAERALDALELERTDANGNKVDLVIPAIEALRQALAQNPLDIADRAYFAGKKDGIEEAFAQPSTPDDLLRQSEREGWRWAKECEAEVVRLTDLNQRLMAGAQELRDATDTAEFDEAWSKLFKLFKEAI